MRPLGIGGKTGGGQEEGLGNHLLGQPVPCWSTSNKIDMTRDMDESAVLKLSQLETLSLTSKNENLKPENWQPPPGTTGSMLVH